MQQGFSHNSVHLWLFSLWFDFGKRAAKASTTACCWLIPHCPSWALPGIYPRWFWGEIQQIQHHRRLSQHWMKHPRLPEPVWRGWSAQGWRIALKAKARSNEWLGGRKWGLCKWALCVLCSVLPSFLLYIQLNTALIRLLNILHQCLPCTGELSFPLTSLCSCWRKKQYNNFDTFWFFPTIFTFLFP